MKKDFWRKEITVWLCQCHYVYSRCIFKDGEGHGLYPKLPKSHVAPSPPLNASPAWLPAGVALSLNRVPFPHEMKPLITLFLAWVEGGEGQMSLPPWVHRAGGKGGGVASLFPP